MTEAPGAGGRGRRLRVALGIVLRALGLAASALLVFRLFDVRDAAASLRMMPAGVLAGALGIWAVRLYLLSIRWRLLIPSGVGVGQLGLIKLLLAGGALNVFLPGVVGGDLARSLLILHRARANREEALASVLADRIAGLVSAVLLGIAACIAAPSMVHRWQYAAALGVAASALFALFGVATAEPLQRLILHLVGLVRPLRGRATDAVRRGLSAIRNYRIAPAGLVGAVLVSVPIHLLWFLLAYLAARALGTTVSFLVLSAVTTIVWAITLLPISFGGLGVRELSYVHLLAAHGVPRIQAGAVSIFLSTVILVSGLAGLPLVWFGLRRSGASPADEESSR